jgi:integrase
VNRPRKNNPDLLPPCVYFKHGRYWYVKKGRWTDLGNDRKAALKVHLKIIITPTGGMAKLIDDTLEHIRPALSQNTIDQYEGAARKLKTAFVEFAPNQVKTLHVRQFRKAGRKTPNMTNRCLSLLRQVFNYGLDEEISGLESNPTIGVPRLKEGKRDRLITPTEYAAIRASSAPREQVIWDLCIRTGKRIKKVLVIKRFDLLEEGIRFPPDKAERNAIIVKWTPELREVVERAKKLRGNVASLTLLSNRRGKAPDYSTIKDCWDRACQKAAVLDANIHDLRAVAASKAKKQGKNPTKLLNHSSEQQTVRYLRDREVEEVEGPSFDEPVLDKSK